MLRKHAAGGITNVFRTHTKVGESKISYLEMKDGIVYVVETENVASNNAAYDAGSLYQSSTFGGEHPLNPYGDHGMRMPARLTGYFNVNQKKKSEVENLIAKDKILKIINDRKSDKLFFATIKGRIRATDEERENGIEVDGKVLKGTAADEYYINKCINFPPVIRNTIIAISEQTLGSITMNQIEKEHEVDGEKITLKIPKEVRKLTQLHDTQGTFMGVSTALLWLWIDTCHFVVEDVKKLALFTSTICFEK
jgi:hypothetical protein